MKKYNVLMAHNYYQVPGGEDTVFHNEIEMLEKNGHKVIMYTRHNNEIKKGIFSRLKLALDTIFSLNTYKEVKKLIDKGDIDIVHVHNTWPLISPSIYYAAKAKKVPVVQTIHNFRLLCPGATFTRNGEICEDCLSNGLGQSLKNKCYRNSLLQTFIMNSMLIVHRVIGTYKHVDKYIALTKFSKSKFNKLLNNESQIEVKPNFLPSISKYSRELQNYFVYIGRLDNIKGINFLIDAWKDIDTKIELKVIGDGELRENILKYINENNITNISVLGFMKREDAFKIIKSSKGIIIPSQCYENFPMTILEAFSMGVPVIGSEIGNIATIIKDGYNGILFNKDSKEILKNKVEELFYDDDYNLELGNNAYSTFISKYTDDINYKELYRIYSGLVGDINVN